MDTVKEHLPPSHKLTVDLDNYKFPIHISPTDLRPDIVLCLELLASCWNKEKFKCYEAKIEESEKAGSHRESNPGDLACMCSQCSLFLPQNYFRFKTSGLCQHPPPPPHPTDQMKPHCTRYQGSERLCLVKALTCYAEGLPR